MFKRKIALADDRSPYSPYSVLFHAKEPGVPAVWSLKLFLRLGRTYISNHFARTQNTFILFMFT